MDDIEHKTTLIMEGLRIILINDKENVFYPILYANIEKFSFEIENKL